MSEQDMIAGILIDVAKKVLADVQQRCTEALKALEQSDYLVGIGALAGLEEQLRSVSVRLTVLREIKEIQKQTKTKEGKINGRTKTRRNPGCAEKKTLGEKRRR